jgi:hypothetical protein
MKPIRDLDKPPAAKEPTMSPENITLQDLLAMNNQQRAQIVKTAHPFDPAALAGNMYLGIDLSLPPIMNKILWKTFRKTFHLDPQTNVLRGWNVRMEQTGYDGPGTPMTDKRGKQIAFGHYHVLSAKGKRFPQQWTGEQYLDYTVSGNPVYDVAGLGYCPLVAVNQGSSDLLLGWEVFKLGPVFVPLPDFWALQKSGPLDEIVATPRP